MKQEQDKYTLMTTGPVKGLIIRMAIPTIITMLITAVYNMADTFFVGKLGNSATGAVGVAFSLMALIQALGFLMGQGSGNFISRLLGAKNQEKSEIVAAIGFFTTFFVGVILAVIGLLNIDNITELLGSTETIKPFAKDYISVIFIGLPFIASSFVLNNILRFQGSAFYGMIGIGFGGLLNAVLDPLLIYVFDMGVRGAAVATVISQITSFCILLYCCTKGGNIKIKFKNFKPRLSLYVEILKGGFPSLCRQGMASIAAICLNRCAKPYGDPAIAAMSIVTRVIMFAISALLGFGQGFQPVCGFNYGARKYKRVLDGYFFCMKVASAGLLLLSATGIIFAPQIISAFRDDEQVIEIGAKALRLQCIPFILSAFIVTTNMLTQTIGRALEATVISMCRQGIFFIPLVFILSAQFGLLGVQIIQPVSDVCTFLVALPLGIRVIRDLQSKQKAIDIERVN